MKATLLIVLLISALTITGALGSVFAAAAQDIPVFGYPYDTNAMSGGGSYQFYGARFSLSGKATIDAIACKQWISYNSTQPTAVTHYRYAIYQDNAGSVGNLIAQTKVGGENIPVDGPYDNDKWRTLNLETPVSLNPGVYWLLEVGDSGSINIHCEPMTSEQHEIVLGILGGMDFPQTINKETILAPTIYSIYAIGQGVSSVMPPPIPDASHPGVSALSVNCQASRSSNNEIEVFGNLTSYGSPIPQAAVSFSYTESSASDNWQQLVNASWRQFASTTTAADGSYSVSWIPPSPGNYKINATYWGDTIHSFVFTEADVLVTAQAGNQTHKVFSVDSNSTVTDLAFNSDTNELSFSVTGQEGTSGYSTISIDKSLVTDPSQIQAYIDGNLANFTVQPTNDAWLLYFTYHHSTHNVKFALNRSESNQVPEFSAPQIMLVLIAFATVALVAKKLIFTNKSLQVAKNS